MDVKPKTSIIKSNISSREAIEVERWVQATQRVLTSAASPLHYMDIKRVIAENKLIPLGLKTTLEVALLTEVQRPGARLTKVEGQSGVFRITTEAERAGHHVQHQTPPPPPKPHPPPQHASQPTPPTAPTAKTQPPKVQPGKPQPVKTQPSKSQPAKPQSAPRVKPKSSHCSSGGINSNEKYRHKYLRLKKFIKHMVFQNAALCDEVVKIDSSVAQVREQRRDSASIVAPPVGSSRNHRRSDHVTQTRQSVQILISEEAVDSTNPADKFSYRYLLRRLQQYQVFPEVPPPPAQPKPVAPTAVSAPPGGTTSSVSPSAAKPTPAQPPPVNPAEVKMEPGDNKLKVKKQKATPNPKSKKAHSKEPIPVIATGEIAKPKPKKSKGGSAKRLVVPILLDNTGRPVFPIELGPLTIHSLGEITTDRSRYHSTEHIYPVGFCSTRIYCSLRDPGQKTLYTCKILDCGMAPKFEISPEDAPEHVISCDSADECHTQLLAYVNHSRGVEVVTPEPRGAEFFGFSHPTVQNLIQCCPGARKCSGYKWVRFEVCRTDPTEALNFFNNDPVINYEALQQSQKFHAAMEQQKQLQQATALLEPTSSLRSLLTSGPLIQGSH